jgi:hypothetical protein
MNAGPADVAALAAEATARSQARAEHDRAKAEECAERVRELLRNAENDAEWLND